jgi:hypothetical protein
MEQKSAEGGLGVGGGAASDAEFDWRRWTRIAPHLGHLPAFVRGRNFRVAGPQAADHCLMQLGLLEAGNSIPCGRPAILLLERRMPG